MNSQPINKFDLATELINYTTTNVFLTGKAGTGKTTFLRGLLEVCNKKHVVVAPTGVAAINAKGVTIHSFFQLPLCPFLPDANSLTSSISVANADVIKELELLIIDEVSMLRADLLDAIDYRLRKTRKNSAPFGGVQLLLIGDLFQLPPVAVEEEMEQLKEHYDSLFFFESKALKNTDYVTIELDRVFRQDGKEFKEILNSIREGNVSRYILEQLNKRYISDFVPQKEDSYIRLVTHNSQVDKINKKEMESLEGKEYTYRARIEGDFPFSLYPVAYLLTLKVGAQVMTTKNKTDSNCDGDISAKKQMYYNGALGIVTELKDDVVKIKLHHNNEIITIVPEKWDNIVYKVVENEEKGSDGKLHKKKEIIEEVIGSFTQYPLRPAWAITIHKSQGLTFDHAIIDISRSFMAGQTYVALSRCRSLEGIVLSEKVDWKSIKCDPIVKEFYKNEKKRFPDEAEIDERLRDTYVNSLRSNLNMSAIEEKLVKLINEFMNSNDALDSADVASLISAHRDFSLASGICSEKFLSHVVILINGTQTYSQNAEIQQMISDIANHHLNNIQRLANYLDDLGKRISCKNTSLLLDSLESSIIISLKISEYIKENGFNLIGCQRIIKYYGS